MILKRKRTTQTPIASNTCRARIMTVSKRVIGCLGSLSRSQDKAPKSRKTIAVHEASSILLRTHVEGRRGCANFPA